MQQEGYDLGIHPEQQMLQDASVPLSQLRVTGARGVVTYSSGGGSQQVPMQMWNAAQSQKSTMPNQVIQRQHVSTHALQPQHVSTHAPQPQRVPYQQQLRQQYAPQHTKQEFGRCPNCNHGIMPSQRNAPSVAQHPQLQQQQQHIHHYQHQHQHQQQQQQQQQSALMTTNALNPYQLPVPAPLTPNGKFHDPIRSYEYRNDLEPYQEQAARAGVFKGMRQPQMGEVAPPQEHENLPTHSHTLNKTYPHSYLNRQPGSPGHTEWSGSGRSGNEDYGGRNDRMYSGHERRGGGLGGSGGGGGGGGGGRSPYEPLPGGVYESSPLPFARVAKRQQGSPGTGNIDSQNQPSWGGLTGEGGTALSHPGTQNQTGPRRRGPGQVHTNPTEMVTPAGGRSGVAVYRYGDGPTRLQEEYQSSMRQDRPQAFGS